MSMSAPNGRAHGLVLLIFFVGILLGPPAAANDPNAAPPVPAKFKVTVSAERSEYVLGENVIISFILENTGTEEFTVAFGGDYRGGTRANRFKVTATDPKGQEVDDPDPDQMIFGGFGSELELGPGKTHHEKISLARYCRITTPGTYRVRVSHDCGWRTSGGQLPTGETKITFRMPSEKEAEAIVAKMEESSARTRLPNGLRDWSDLANLHQSSDFASLHVPIYLKPLLRLARTGDVQALIGIGSIANPEATSALILLATDSDGEFALQTAAVLKKRLPDLIFPDRPPKLTAQARLAAKAWDERLRPGALSVARKWLTRQDVEFVAAAAGILRLLGNDEDAMALLNTLDRVIKPLTSPRGEDTDLGNYPKPARELLEAMFGLRTRGYACHETALTSDGAVVAYLDSFRAKPLPRPAGWKQLFEASCASPCVVLREAAIRSVPYPVPPECAALVTAAKADPDAGVRSAVLFVTERKIIVHPPPGFPKDIPPRVIELPVDDAQSKGVLK